MIFFLWRLQQNVSRHEDVVRDVDYNDDDGDTQVVVRVLGANLYSPVFSQRFYLAEIQENAPPGSKVIQVKLSILLLTQYCFHHDLWRGNCPPWEMWLNLAMTILTLFSRISIWTSRFVQPMKTLGCLARLPTPSSTTLGKLSSASMQMEPYPPLRN